MKIGIIGMGDMGKMFARLWTSAGFQVYGCDLPINFEILKEFYQDSNIIILKDAIEISSLCDFIMYCVEADNIEKVVKHAGKYTKPNAIVTGQTSVKTPEMKAFEAYLPKSVQIVGSHALFGPNVNPEKQIIAIFNHRATPEAFFIAKEIFESVGSKIEILPDYETHDKMMADIQVVTHIGFESIGTAFMHRKAFPWEDKSKISGIDNIKILLTLRIFSYKSHVYSGLAFNNPKAKSDVRKFATIENEIFGLMISEKREKLTKKILQARDSVFGQHSSKLMLDDSFLEEYTLNPGENHKPNSHLSLLSMVCTWADLKINPYQNMVCQTPPFKLRVGLAEYLFLNEALLMETIEAACFDKSILEDDLAFHTAVHEWSNIVELGDKGAYEQHFDKTKKFLGPRLAEGREKSNELIAKLNSKI